MTFAKRLATVAAVAALAVGAAHAHRAWILPSATVFSKEGSVVTIDAAASNTLFFPDHRPMGIDQIQVHAPDGSTVKPLNPTVGSTRTTFDVKLDKPGTYRIAAASVGGGRADGGAQPVLGTSNGPFSAQWTEGAETKRWRGTLAEYTAQGIDKKKGAALSISNRRVETFVTVGKPTPVPLTGKGLELSGGAHPNDLYAGEDISLTFADNGKPAANVELELISGGERYRDKENVITVKTDKDGVAKINFPAAGMYWLSGQAAGNVSMEGLMVKSQSTYVAVLEVLPS